MQYQVKVSDEPKFKFSEFQNKVVIEHEDEYKSDSESASSLFTEEDIIGQASPKERIEVCPKRHESEKDMTGPLTNIVGSTRSLLISESSLKDTKDLNKSLEKKEKNPFNNNLSLKTTLEHILTLKNELKLTRNSLKSAQNSIFTEETQQIDLKTKLDDLKKASESDLSTKKTGCSCGFFNLF